MRQHLFACILAMLCLLPACDVHEFPEPPVPSVALSLDLKFMFGMGDLEDFKTIYVTTRAAAPTYEARYQLRIHPADGKGGFLKDSYQTYVFNQSELEALDYRLPVEIVPGKYRFRAWVDFV